jgi:hypothetical protein
VKVGEVPFGQMLNAFGEEKKGHKKIFKKHLFDFSQRLWYITILPMVFALEVGHEHASDYS